jgi:uncharacterized small protein (DUF1192 family)
MSYCDNDACDEETHAECSYRIALGAEIERLKAKEAYYEYPLRSNSWIRVSEEAWDEQQAKIERQQSEIARLQNSENELDAVIDGLRDKLKIGNPAAEEK